MTFDDWLISEKLVDLPPVSEAIMRRMWDAAAGPEPAQPVYPYYGWLCPRCGMGNAPSTGTCPCVPAEPIVWTC